MAYWGNATLAAMNTLPLGAKKAVWELNYRTAVPTTVGWDMDSFLPITTEHRKWFGSWAGFNADLSLEAFFGPFKYENWLAMNGTFQSLLDVFLHGWKGENCTFVLEPGNQNTQGWGWTNCSGKKVVHLVVQHFVESSTSLLASTICHELLHCRHGIDDQMLVYPKGEKAYQPYGVRVLGTYYPEKAILNTDNYAFWLYGMYYFWSQNCKLFKPFTYLGKTYSFDIKSQSWYHPHDGGK